MRNKMIIGVVMLSVCGLVWQACHTAQNSLDNDPLSNEYYLKHEKVPNRLAAMLVGRYLCYKGIEKKEVWRVNEDRDSLIFRVLQVGNPAKDGFWFYHELIMTHMPNRPIEQFFTKIETTSERDSLILQEYEAYDVSVYTGIVEESEAAKKVNVNKLIPIKCKRYLIKLDQTYFEGKTIGDCHFSRKGDDVKYLKAEEKIYPLGRSLYCRYLERDKTIKEQDRFYYKRLRE